MSIPTLEPGLVIFHSDRWHYEHLAGADKCGNVARTARSDEFRKHSMHVILGIVFLLILVAVTLNSRSREKADEHKRLEKADSYSDPEARNRIKDKRIWHGLTANQLVDSWGQPTGRSRRILKTKIKETYSYGSRHYGSKVYLDDGIVVGWNQHS